MSALEISTLGLKPIISYAVLRNAASFNLSAVSLPKFLSTILYS